MNHTSMKSVPTDQQKYAFRWTGKCSAKDRSRFFLVIYLLACILPLGCGIDTHTGCISGILYRRNPTSIEPITYEKMLVNRTHLVTGTDSLGRFFFGELEPGYYSVTNLNSSVFFGNYTRDSVQVIAGDTTYLDMRIMDVSSEYPPPFSWEMQDRGEWIELLFEVSVPEDRCTDGLIVYSDGSRCPVDPLENGLYSILVPPDFKIFIWSLPWLGTQRTRIRDCRQVREYPVCLEADTSHQFLWQEVATFYSPALDDRFILSQADQTMNEWTSPEWNVRHEIVDPRLWGDQHLVRSGVMGSTIRFLDDEVESWELTLVYCNKYVVICEETPGIAVSLHPTMRTVDISPSGIFALLRPLVREFPDHDYWLLLNTRTGERSTFDPFPEMFPAEEQGYFRPTSGMVFRPQRDFFLSDDGTVVGRFDEELRTYDKFGHQNMLLYDRDIAFFQSSSSPFIFNTSPDNDGWSLLLSTENGTRLITGDVADFSEWTIDSESLGPCCRLALSNSCRSVAISGRYGDLMMYNTISESLDSLRTDGSVNDMILSGDGRLIGYTSGVYGCFLDFWCYVRDASSIDSDPYLSFPGFSLHWHYPVIQCLADTGWLLLTISARDSSRRYSRFALISNTGELVWLSRGESDLAGRDRFPTWAEVSQSSNRFAFCDGHFVHILTIEDD